MSKPGKKKGSPKTGGRKKGTPNKKSRFVRELLENQKFDPVTECVVVFRKAMDKFEHQNHSEFQFKWLEIAGKQCHELMKYCYPQLKAIDHNLTEDTQNSLTDIIKELRKSGKL